MSELKSYDLVDIQDYRGEVYLKSEADNVIAELKDKCQMHDFFWEGCGFAKRGFKNAIAVSIAFDKLEAEARHQKYKRCLAMAKMCGNAYDKWMMKKANAIGLGKDGVEYYLEARWKVSHYMRWHKRWLELAEKFKQGFAIGVDEATGTDKTVVINCKEAK